MQIQLQLEEEQELYRQQQESHPQYQMLSRKPTQQKDIPVRAEENIASHHRSNFHTSSKEKNHEGSESTAVAKLPSLMKPGKAFNLVALNNVSRFSYIEGIGKMKQKKELASRLASRILMG